MGINTDQFNITSNKLTSTLQTASGSPIVLSPSQELSFGFNSNQFSITSNELQSTLSPASGEPISINPSNDISLTIDSSSLQKSGGTLAIKSSVMSDISNLKSDMTTAKSNISTIQSDLTTVQSDVVALDADVAALDGTVAGISSDIGTIDATLAGVALSIASLTAANINEDITIGQHTTNWTNLYYSQAHSAFWTDFFVYNLGSNNISSQSLLITNNATINNLYSSVSTLGNFIINSAGNIYSNSTVSSINLSNISTTNLTVVNTTFTGSTISNLNLTNLVSTNNTLSNALITNGLKSIFNSNTIGNIYTTGGNIGINTTSPSFLLDVNGNARLTNLQATLISGSNLLITNASISTLNLTNSSITNSLLTNSSISTLNLTNSSITNSLITNASISTLKCSNEIITNSTITNTLNSTNVLLTNLTSPNNILTNIINTNLSSANITNSGLISTSNLQATNSTLSNLINSGLISTSNLQATNSTIPNIISTNITTNNLKIIGYDLNLGFGDTIRGSSGNARALVKDYNSTLVINYNGDFTGGVNIHSNVLITGTCTVPNILVTNISSASITNSGLISSSNLQTTNSTFANILSTTISSSNIRISGLISTSNLQATNSTIPNIVHTNITYTNSLGTNQTVSNILTTNLLATNISTNSIKTDSFQINSYDLQVGQFEQVIRGNSGNSRAIVKYGTGNTTSSLLVINFANDFSAGTQVQSNVDITGTLSVSSSVTMSNLSLNNITVGNLNTGSLNSTNITSNNAVFTNTSTTNLIGSYGLLASCTIPNLLSTNISSSSLVLNNTTQVTSPGLLLTNNNAGGIIAGLDLNHSIWLRKSYSGSTDCTGIYEYGKLSFFTGGGIASQTERMTITSIGNVGINQASPTYPLDVNGIIHGDKLQLGSSSTNGGAVLNLFYNNSDTEPWQIGKNTGGSASLTFNQYGSGSEFSIDANSNISTGNINCSKITSPSTFQSGSTYYTTSGITVYFPIAFSNTPHVFITSNDNTTGRAPSYKVTSVSSTSFFTYANDGIAQLANGSQFSWFAFAT